MKTIIQNIVNSFVDFLAACRNAFRGQSKRAMYGVYRGWEREEAEWEESHMTHLRFRYVPRITDANMNAANQNSRLRLVSRCLRLL
jgi:hypothetical protein